MVNKSIKKGNLLIFFSTSQRLKHFGLIGYSGRYVIVHGITAIIFIDFL